MTKTLTEKQQIFVDQYLVDLNATKAAIRSGYSEKTAYSQGHELLKKPEIAEAIAKAQAERAERTKIDGDWVLKRLEIIVERCLQAEPVTDREGNPTGEYVFNAAGANKAIELIGKHHGVKAWAGDKIELTGKNGGPIEVEALSEAERAARMSKLLASAQSRAGGHESE